MADRPPVRDREQAREIVRKLITEHLACPVYSPPLPERIVDALLPQPDPEVERLRAEIERLGQESAYREDERREALIDLERAEESLRAVTEAAQEILDGPWLTEGPKDRLRTVLSSHPEPGEGG